MELNRSHVHWLEKIQKSLNEFQIVISPASRVIFRYIAVVWDLTSTEVENDLRT